MNINNRILKLNNIEKRIIEIALVIYVVISLFREYRFIEPLSTVGRLSRYFILFLFVYIFLFIFIKNSRAIFRIVKNYRILSTHIMLIFLSMIFNLTYFKEYISYIIFMVFCIVAVIALGKKFNKIIFLLYVCAGIYTFYSVFISKDIYIAPGSRSFFFLELSRVKLDTEGIQFSIIATYMGTLSIMWLSAVKNRTFKYLGFVILGYLSLSIGKITIVMTLLLVVIMYLMMRILKSRGKYVVYSSLIFTAFSSIIITQLIIPIFDISVYQADILFNHRITVWGNYLYNIFNGRVLDFFFGYGFFDSSSYSGFLLFHPHNQFLGSWYITGLFGFVSYLLVWFDAFKITYRKNNAEKNYFDTVLLLFILFIQIGDDYIFFTMEPLYLMLFMYIYFKNSIGERMNFKDNKNYITEGC